MGRADPSYIPSPDSKRCRRSVVACAVAQIFLGVAVTASLAAAPPAAHAQQAQAAQTWRIPAGPLTEALNRFGSQAGIMLSFSTEMTNGLHTPGLEGAHTVEEALRALLAGTGLAAERQANGGYILRRLPAASGKEVTLPAVTVTAANTQGTAASAYRARNASVGVLGDKSLKDTPYSIEVYSRELMDNKQARALADIIKADASVGLMVDKSFGESWVGVRGLEVDLYNAKKLDGMSFSMFLTELPLEHMERVEVLKGAGGLLYGFAAPGGIVNYVLKRPTDEPVRSLSSQITDSGLALIHGDGGGRFGTGGAFGYRVNLVHESGDTYVDDGKSRLSSGSVALDWRITPGLVWQIDALKGEHLRRAAYPWVTPSTTGTLAGGFSGNAEPPSPIDGSKRVAPSFGRTYTEYETYGTDLSWQFMPDWKLSLAYRSMEEGREFINGGTILANAQGDYTIFAQNFSGSLKSRHAQAMVAGKLATGPVGHDLTVGASNNKSDNGVSWMGGRYETAVLGPANLADPVDFANPFSSHVSIDEATGRIDLVRRREIFASDTLHVGADWDLIVGLRRSQLAVKDAGYDKRATTPTLAAVFRPTEGLSLYGSYVEALEQGETAPTTAANAGQVFEPLESKQYEVGAKAEGGDWSATAALFRLQRGLTYTTANNVFTQDGEARYQGVELSGKFRLSPQWLLTASTLWLDATNRKTTGGTLDGKRIQGVAREQASLYGEYRVAGLPLTLTAGAHYVGKRPVDANNQWHVGSVTLLDAGARYETKWGNNPVTLRLNADNLTNEAYWVTRPGSATLVQGAPRTVKLGAQFDF